MMAKVTGKLQITLPKVLAGQCGIRVGDDLKLSVVGRSIQITRAEPGDVDQLRRDRLGQFDRATARQRVRERAVRFARARSRGWTRDELYDRGRAR